MHKTLELLQHDLEGELRHLHAEQTQLRTGDDPKRWSIQQIVEHLCLTYVLSARAFEARLTKATSTTVRPSLGQRAGQFVVLTLGRFPSGRKAPEAVMPMAMPEPRSGEQLGRGAVELLARFDGLAEDVERRFGTGRVVRHQVLGPLSVSQWRAFQLIHGSHHLKQIRAIRESHGLLQDRG